MQFFELASGFRLVLRSRLRRPYDVPPPNITSPGAAGIKGDQTLIVRPLGGLCQSVPNTL